MTYQVFVNCYLAMLLYLLYIEYRLLRKQAEYKDKRLCELEDEFNKLFHEVRRKQWEEKS